MATTNVTTNAGKGVVTAALVAYTSVPKYLGIGSGTGGGATSTDLATPIAESRATGTASQVTTTTTNDTYQVAGSVAITGTRAITELGLFTTAGTGSPPSGGTLYQYHEFAVVNLISGDTLDPTVKTTF